MNYILAVILMAVWLAASASSVLAAKGVAAWGDFLKLSFLGGFFGTLAFGLLGVLLAGVILFSFWSDLDVVFAVSIAMCLGCFLGTFGMTYGNRKEWAREG
jgi:hypothetical protein